MTLEEMDFVIKEETKRIVEIEAGCSVLKCNIPIKKYSKGDIKAELATIFHDRRYWLGCKKAGNNLALTVMFETFDHLIRDYHTYLIIIDEWKKI